MTKNDIYEKYKDGKQASFIFSYLKTEYHLEPIEFLDCDSGYETAEALLKRLINNSDKDFVKRQIDNFFCDIKLHTAQRSLPTWI